MPASPLFIFILFKNIFIEKVVDFSGIRTWIVEVEGEHADHLTTTTTPLSLYSYQGWPFQLYRVLQLKCLSPA